ncbi:MAG: type I restriction endonuclease [Planctomycetota bacterium]
MEATKAALVLPFIQSLGDGVFNPSEVVPEFTADVGIKKGEKVDYAICREGAPIILFECKPHGAKLDSYSSQLYRYFSVTKARIAILTDGIVYRIYSDLLEPNKLDPKPFLTVSLVNLKRTSIEQLSKMSKKEFDLDVLLSAAEDLRMMAQIRQEFIKQLESPTDQFLRVLIDPVYSGRMTAQVLDRFRDLVKASLRSHITEAVDSRLRAALEKNGGAVPASTEQVPGAQEPESDAIETTEEELEGLYAIKAIVQDLVEPQRITPRDVQSYFGVLLDNNNRRPICRLWFNGGKKYLGVFDENKKETRIPVSGPNDLFQHAEQVRQLLHHVMK